MNCKIKIIFKNTGKNIAVGFVPPPSKFLRYYLVFSNLQYPFLVNFLEYGVFIKYLEKDTIRY